ncbi:hypothetical protein ACNF49_25825 [Actinomadura sp. ATCC 39365]
MADWQASARWMPPHLLCAADGLIVMDMDELLAERCAKLAGLRQDVAAHLTMGRRAGHPVLPLCPVPSIRQNICASPG